MHKKKKKRTKSTMLVFGVYDGDRVSIDVPIGASVGDVKKMFQNEFRIYIDDMSKKDRNIIVLHYAGSDLDEQWCFTDLGIEAGSTIRVIMKEEVKPVLYIECSYNKKTIDIVDKEMIVPQAFADDIRTLVSKKTGIPVSIFRLVAESGQEIYDGHQLYDYSVDAGQTIRMENWDGWNEFINLCIMGFTPKVLSQLSNDEVISKFQMKVALHISAHYGCVDLARSLVKQGIRADEHIGEHPYRQWCSSYKHIETQKAPIHEAVECGQLAVLRMFVNHDITVVMAKNGNDLTGLNIALRNSIKHCASFLLTRQWTKVPVGKYGSISVQTLRRVKQWCEVSKEKTFAKFGQVKSTLKKRSFTGGALVSNGDPVVDGFTPSPMTGKPKSQMKDGDKREQFDIFREVYGLRDDPEHYFKQMGTFENFKNLKIRRNTKWGNMIDRSDVAVKLTQGIVPGETENKPKGGGILKGILSKGNTGSTSETPQSQAEQNTSSKGLGKLLRTGTSTSVADSTISEEEPKPKMPLGKANLMGKFLRGGNQPILEIENENKEQNQQAKPGLLGKLLKSGPQASEAESVTDKSRKGSIVDVDNSKGNAVPRLPPILSKRKNNQDAIQEEKENVEIDETAKANFIQTPSNKKNPLSKSLPNLKIDKSKANATGDEPQTPTSNNEKPGSSTKKKKKKRISSAVLLSKAKSSDGAIPLPLISKENTSRPFFYHNGLREEDFVMPMLDVVSEYKGSSSTDRAIKSLTIANTFDKKPWLSKVRMAIALTTQSIKRSVKDSGWVSDRSLTSSEL